MVGGPTCRWAVDESNWVSESTVPSTSKTDHQAIDCLNAADAAAVSCESTECAAEQLALASAAARDTSLLLWSDWLPLQFSVYAMSDGRWKSLSDHVILAIISFPFNLAWIRCNSQSFSKRAACKLFVANKTITSKIDIFWDYYFTSRKKITSIKYASTMCINITVLTKHV